MQGKCQRLLTVAFGAFGGVLDGGEGCVDLEHVGDMLRSLRLESIVAEAAKRESHSGVRGY